MRKLSLVATIVIVLLGVLSVMFAAGVVPNPLSTYTIVQDVSKTLNKPANATLVKSISDQGITFELYVQPVIRIGDAAEIHILVKNVANSANLYPSTGQITITDSGGTKVYETSFAKLHPGSLPVGGAWELTALWDTSTGYAGRSLQPGTYAIQFSVNIVGLSPMTLASSATVTLSQ